MDNRTFFFIVALAAFLLGLGAAKLIKWFIRKTEPLNAKPETEPESVRIKLYQDQINDMMFHCERQGELNRELQAANEELETERTLLIQHVNRFYDEGGIK